MGVIYVLCVQFKYLCLNHRKIIDFHLAITGCSKLRNATQRNEMKRN